MLRCLALRSDDNGDSYLLNYVPADTLVACPFRE
jgi:hypothetical protein